MMQLPDSLLRFAWLPFMALLLPAASAQLSGTVLGPTGEAVVNARVELEGGLLSSGLRKALGETQSDASGAFAFPNAKGETLLVRANAPGLATGGRFLNRADQREGIEIRCAEGFEIEGVVLGKEDGKPIDNVRIDAGLARTRSDKDGRFLLAGLAQDADKVTLIRQGYVPRFVYVTGKPRGIGSSLQWEMSRGLSLKVHVDSGDERYLANDVEVTAQVFLAPAYSALEQGDYRTSTNDRGDAVLRGLPPGQPVVVEAFSERFGWAQSAVISPERAPGKVVEVSLVRSGKFFAYASDAEGDPIPNALVRILPLVEPLLNFGDGAKGGARSEARTTDDGTVEISGLQGGPVSVQVQAPGFCPIQIFPGEVSNGQGLEWRFELTSDEHSDPGLSRWCASLTEAFARSEAENVPVLFSLTRDDERASDYMAAHHYRSPSFQRFASIMPVVLINNHGKGGLSSQTPHEEVDGICTRYGDGPCSNHQFGSSYFLNQLVIPGQEIQVPQQVILTAAGERLAQRDFLLTERDLEWLMMRALIMTRLDLAQKEAERRFWPHLEMFSAELLGELVVEVLPQAANAGDQFALALISALPERDIEARFVVAVLRQLNVDVIMQTPEALTPLLINEDVSIVRAALMCLEAPVPTRSEDLNESLYELMSHGDQAVRERARSLLGVSMSGGSAQQEFVTIADDARAPALIAAFLDRYEWHQIIGAERTLLRSDAATRAQLLLTMAGHIGGEASARARVFQAARWKDWRAAPALNALKVYPLFMGESARLAELIKRHRDSSPLVRETMRGWLESLAEEGYPGAKDSLSDYAEPAGRVGSGR